MRIVWAEKAWDNFLVFEREDKQKYKRIIALIKDIMRNGYNGIGKPEALREDLSGFWSRRIDEKNRLVYKLEDDSVLIAQCGSHYQDK